MPETLNPETRNPETRNPETRNPETRNPETRNPETRNGRSVWLRPLQHLSTAPAGRAARHLYLT